MDLLVSVARQLIALALPATKMENPARGIGPCRLWKKSSKPVRRQHDHLVPWGVWRTNFEHLRETKDLQLVDPMTMEQNAGGNQQIASAPAPFEGIVEGMV
jgi:hypothetical protein